MNNLCYQTRLNGSSKIDCVNLKHFVFLTPVTRVPIFIGKPVKLKRPQPVPIFIGR